MCSGSGAELRGGQQNLPVERAAPIVRTSSSRQGREATGTEEGGSWESPSTSPCGCEPKAPFAGPRSSSARQCQSRFYRRAHETRSARWGDQLQRDTNDTPAFPSRPSAMNSHWLRNDPDFVRLPTSAQSFVHLSALPNRALVHRHRGAVNVWPTRGEPSRRFWKQSA